jgi:hypothetical protein
MKHSVIQRGHWIGMVLATITLISATGQFSLAWGQVAHPTRAIVTQDAVQVENVGLKPIAAIEGTFSYQLPTGQIATPSWTQTFSVAMFKNGRAFDPGQQLTFPKAQRLPDGTVQVMNYLDVTVTAIVFSDGTVWGAGKALREKVIDTVASRRTQLREALQVLQTTSLEKIQSILHDSGPIIEGQSRSLWLKAALKERLLDKKGQVYADALDRLQQMIDDLETPFKT